jgi:hypothetical protein
MLSRFIRVFGPVQHPQLAIPRTDGVVFFEFLLSRELEECGGEIMPVFGISVYHRDYENEWEWLEGTNETGLSVNVSRPHDWTQGIYDEPVSVSVSQEAGMMDAALATKWGGQLAESLGVEVRIGRRVAMPGDGRYRFQIDHRFLPPA